MFKNTEKHESYGVIGFNRSYGGERALFGSSILHNNVITLTIREGERDRCLNKDWYHGRRRLIEIEMSQSQFAELITSFGQGDGVPCTIRELMGERKADCPFENKRMQFENEMKEHVEEIHSDTEKLIKEVAYLFNEKKTLNKADKERVTDLLNKINREIKSNTPFIMSQFNEQMDETVKEAKGEVEAFTQNKMHSLALEALKQDNKWISDIKNTNVLLETPKKMED